MPLKSVTSSQIADNETQKQCNELVQIVSAQRWDIEQALNTHKQLDTYIGESLKNNPRFYSESELTFLIDFIVKLSKLLDSEKQKLAIELRNQQKNKKAVNKYKSNS